MLLHLNHKQKVNRLHDKKSIFLLRKFSYHKIKTRNYSCNTKRSCYCLFGELQFTSSYMQGYNHKFTILSCCPVGSQGQRKKFLKLCVWLNSLTLEFTKYSFLYTWGWEYLLTNPIKYTNTDIKNLLTAC